MTATTAITTTQSTNTTRNPAVQLVRDTWEMLDQTPKSKYQTRLLLDDVTSIHFDYLNNK